jgi:hypothetical protein
VIDASDLVYRVEAGRVTRETVRHSGGQKQIAGRVVQAKFGAGASAA